MLGRDELLKQDKQKRSPGRTMSSASRSDARPLVSKPVRNMAAQATPPKPPRQKSPATVHGSASYKTPTGSPALWQKAASFKTNPSTDYVPLVNPDDHYPNQYGSRMVQRTDKDNNSVYSYDSDNFSMCSDIIRHMNAHTED